MKRYEQVIDLIRQRIEKGTLKAGDKLPSVRQLHKSIGCSMTTIQHAYALLESDGTVTAKPRSGYFVADNTATATDFAESGHENDPTDRPVSVDELAFRVTSLWHRADLEAFGALYPSRDLVGRDKIDQTLRQVLRTQVRHIHKMDSPEGDPLLREVIGRRAVSKGIIVRPADVAIMGRGIQGLDISIEALTSPGDVVLVESPSFFPIFAALQRYGLRAVEIYSHPKFGIDPNQFEYLLHNNTIRACILMPVHHYPTGITYSPATMQAVVASAARRNVPIIEIDLFGDLAFDGDVMSSLKQYDEQDNVLHFSTLGGLSAHGYGISSVISTRYQPLLIQRQYMSALSSGDGVVQRAIAEHITNSAYDRQLRRVRTILKERVARGLQLISEHFPSSCAVSLPTGGFMCWIRGPRDFDALKASPIALTHQISQPPGPMFSVTNSFSNFIALNLSLPWTEERVRKLKTVGALLRSP